MKNIGLVLFFIFVFGGVFALDFKLDSEIRTRFVMMMNKDMDFNRSADFNIIDSRLRMGMEVKEYKSPFSFYYQINIGNIPWGDVFKGGGLGYNAVNIETKNAYFAYSQNLMDKFIKIRGKVGIIEFDTPTESELDADLPAFLLKFAVGDFEVQGMASKPFSGIGSVSGNSTIKISSFELSSTNDALLFYGGLRYGIDKIFNIKAYFMNLSDSRFTYKYSINWAGASASVKLVDLINFMAVMNAPENTLPSEILPDFGFNLDGAFIYNFGSVDNLGVAIPVRAYLLKAGFKLKTPIIDLFANFLLTSGNAENNQSQIAQFQTLGNKGSLGSDLSILFGGSSFNQQTFFNDEISSLHNQNLTTGVISYSDRGIMVLEGGLSKKLMKFYTPKILVGLAYTANPVSNNNLLGIEVDFHNKFDLSKTVALSFCAAVLFPGNAIREAFRLNESGITLGADPVLKLDGQIEMKF